MSRIRARGGRLRFTMPHYGDSEYNFHVSGMLDLDQLNALSPYFRHRISDPTASNSERRLRVSLRTFFMARFIEWVERDNRIDPNGALGS